MSNHSLVLEVASRVGEGAARPGGEPDSVDGVCPKAVAEPSSAESLAGLLKWASQEGLAIAIRGGGTKLDWGGLIRGADLLVSTSRLSSVVAHRHGDLTATIESALD